MAFWGALKPRGTPSALWAGAPVSWISCFIDVVFASGSACVYSSRFPHQAGNFPPSPLKPTGAMLSKAHMVAPQHSREEEPWYPPYLSFTGTPASPLSPHSCFGTFS